MSELDVIVRGRTDRGWLIEAIGGIDLSTVVRLREPVLTAVNFESGPLTLDLRRVDFIDSAGLALLVEARKKIAAGPSELQILLTEGRQPERVLRLGRFDTIMSLISCLDDLPPGGDDGSVREPRRPLNPVIDGAAARPMPSTGHGDDGYEYDRWIVR